MSIASVFGSPIMEQASGGIASLINPLSDVVTYLVPKVAPLFGDTVKIRKKPDESIEHIMPLADRVKVVDEIDALREASGIKRKVIPYASMNPAFSSYGGKFSLTCPVLKLPAQHLFRTEGAGLFGQEKNHEQLHDSNWRFTDNETRFLILKELSRIKQNDALLKLAARIVILVAIISFQFLPGDWMIASCMLGGAGLFHTVVERFYENRNDGIAVKVLSNHLKDSLTATNAALNALKKLQQQNQYQRNNSFFGKLLITEQGDDRFRWGSPSYSKRIEKMKKHLEEIEALERAKLAISEIERESEEVREDAPLLESSTFV